MSQPVWREVAGEHGSRGRGPGRMWLTRGMVLGDLMVFLLLSQVNTQRKAIVQLILEKRELLVGQRVKRDGTANLS